MESIRMNNHSKLMDRFKTHRLCQEEHSHNKDQEVHQFMTTLIDKLQNLARFNVETVSVNNHRKGLSTTKIALTKKEPYLPEKMDQVGTNSLNMQIKY